MKLIKNRTHFFSFLLILVLGTIIYSNTFNSEFQFDDGVHILKENRLNNLSTYSELKTWTNIQNRPLSYFTLAFNKSLNKEHVFGYHLFNFIVHILTSFTVYFLTILLIKQTLILNEKLRANATYYALIVALVFLCHPLQTQAVSYVVQRMTSLAAFFYLGSVFFYLKARLNYVKTRKIMVPAFYFAAMALTGFASLLSKQIAITLPLTYLLVEFYFVKNREGKRFKTYLITGLTTAFLAIVIVIIAGYLPKETSDISRYEYFSTQQRVILKYVQLLVIPIEQNLDYDFPISTSIWGFNELMGLFVILSLLVSIFTFNRKHPLISFGIAWFFINLLLESSIIPIRDVIFEHRVYLPLFGFALALVIFLFEFLKSIKEKQLKVVFVVLLIVLGSFTYARNTVWKTNRSLWADVVEKSPTKLRPHLNLGIAYLHLLKPVKAIEQFNFALKIDTKNWQVYFNRSEAYLLMNQTEKAITDLNEAIELNPDFAGSYDKRGKAKMRLHKLEEARSDFSKAIEINPALESAWFNRSNAFLFIGEVNAAVNDLNQAIKLKPDFAVAYNNRGQINLNLMKYKEALADLDMAISLKPQMISAYNNRAKALFELTDYELAVEDLNKSLALGSRDGNILKLRGECYFKLDFFSAALDDLKRAQELGIQIDEAFIEACKKSLSSTNSYHE